MEQEEKDEEDRGGGREVKETGEGEEHQGGGRREKNGRSRKR